MFPGILFNKSLTIVFSKVGVLKADTSHAFNFELFKYFLTLINEVQDDCVKNGPLVTEHKRQKAKNKKS